MHFLLSGLPTCLILKSLFTLVVFHNYYLDCFFGYCSITAMASMATRASPTTWMFAALMIEMYKGLDRPKAGRGVIPNHLNPKP